MKESTHPYYGAMLVLLSSVAFSSKAIMVKLAYVYHIDAATLIALRMLFAIPFFAGLGWWAMRQGMPVTMTGKDWMTLALLAVVGGYGSMWLNFEGLRYVSAGLERVILFLYPTLVVVMSAVFLKHQITRREWFAMVIAECDCLCRLPAGEWAVDSQARGGPVYCAHHEPRGLCQCLPLWCE